MQNTATPPERMLDNATTSMLKVTSQMSDRMSRNEFQH